MALDSALVFVSTTYDVIDGELDFDEFGRSQRSIGEFQFMRYVDFLEDSTGLRFEMLLPKPHQSENSREAIVSVYSAPPFPRRVHYLFREDETGWQFIKHAVHRKSLLRNMNDTALIGLLESGVWGEYLGTR